MIKKGEKKQKKTELKAKDCPLWYFKVICQSIYRDKLSMSSFPGRLNGDSAAIRTLHCGHIFGPTETQYAPTFLLIARQHNGRAFVEDIPTKM